MRVESEKQDCYKEKQILNTFENHENYNCRAILDDGNAYFVYANWFSNHDLHHWQGWHCESGVSRIMIDKDLKIWNGDCKNDLLGDVAQGWRLFDDFTICRREKCTGCTDDLLTAKWKP